MNSPIIRIAFRHMEHSADIDRTVNKQLQRIIDFVGNEPTPIYIDFVVTPSKLHAHHEIELQVKTPNYEAIVKKEGPDFYNLLDTVVDAMYRKLHDEKDTLVTEHKQKRLNKHKESHEYRKKSRME